MSSAFADLWGSLEQIGRDPSTGGYLRYSWSSADLLAREWFAGQARQRDLSLETDGNGNMWAWWGQAGAGPAVVTGSHLDSVPQGGAFDGPLGVVSALLAIDELRARGVSPARRIGVVVFTEEEGARFGLACLGSRLLAGVVPAERARALTDRDGINLAQALAGAGHDPNALGPDPARLGQIGAFIELHIEQGRALVDQDAPIGVASAIWPHGRWRLEIAGEANHAGTTRMVDRRDPVLTLAYAILAANKAARLSGAHATIGRLAVEPNATNAIAGRATGWLDARAADQSTLDELIADLTEQIGQRASRDGTAATLTAESMTPVTPFDAALTQRVAKRLGGAPLLPTGAGHDAGILANAGVPTAMLFVRNPTGVSHAPSERAELADCAAGVGALADVLAELAC